MEGLCWTLRLAESTNISSSGPDGHKTRAVFDRYNIVSESDLRDAARRLGDYLERKGKEEAIPHTIGTQDEKGGPASDPQTASKLLN